MSFLEREVLFLVFALKLRFMLAQRYNSLLVWEHFQSEKYGLNILSRSDSYFFRVPMFNIQSQHHEPFPTRIHRRPQPPPPLCQSCQGLFCYAANPKYDGTKAGRRTWYQNF